MSLIICQIGGCQLFPACLRVLLLFCFLFDRLENPVKDDLWVKIANEANMAGVQSSAGFYFLFNRLVQDMDDDFCDIIK